ncbi:MAG: hypothetical protein LBT00_13310 [Spirochaetaceae bacterium]|jgi:hypothetical protein|nr:hypothetical protein [Spirochaetaceae bacterium]
MCAFRQPREGDQSGLGIEWESGRSFDSFDFENEQAEEPAVETHTEFMFPLRATEPVEPLGNFDCYVIKVKDEDTGKMRSQICVAISNIQEGSCPFPVANVCVNVSQSARSVNLNKENPEEGFYIGNYFQIEKIKAICNYADDFDSLPPDERVPPQAVKLIAYMEGDDVNPEEIKVSGFSGQIVNAHVEWADYYMGDDTGIVGEIRWIKSDSDNPVESSPWTPGEGSSSIKATLLVIENNGDTGAIEFIQPIRGLRLCLHAWLTRERQTVPHINLPIAYGYGTINVPPVSVPMIGEVIEIESTMPNFTQTGANFYFEGAVENFKQAYITGYMKDFSAEWSGEGYWNGYGYADCKAPAYVPDPKWWWLGAYTYNIWTPCNGTWEGDGWLYYGKADFKGDIYGQITQYGYATADFDLAPTAPLKNQLTISQAGDQIWAGGGYGYFSPTFHESYAYLWEFLDFDKFTVSFRFVIK